MNEYMNIEAVEFARQTMINGRLVRTLSSDDENIRFIQGRVYGVRVVYDDDRLSCMIPWHGVNYVVEED